MVCVEVQLDRRLHDARAATVGLMLITTLVLF